MFRDTKPKWAATLLGIIGVIFIGLTIIFYKCGHRIRAGSRNAKGIELLEEEEQEIIRKEGQALLKRHKG